MARPRKKAAIQPQAKTGRRPYVRPYAGRGEFFKPPKFRNYFTMGELADFVPCDPSWIKHLEREDRIPQAQRVQRGQLSIRLWSPDQAKEIQQIIRNHQMGRPRKDG